MTVFITSDIHLNHRNILQYCPHRGGPEVTDENVDKMNEMIIRNWNSMITPNDEVFILGDVAMGRIDKAPDLIRRLNGIKYLVRGNHDKTLTRVNEDGTRYSDDLFVWVRDYFEYTHKVDGKKYSMSMSHFPFASWNGMNRSSIHFHGHTHGSPTGVTGRTMDVGMDTNGMFPYTMDEAVRRMAKIEVMRDHHSEEK